MKLGMCSFATQDLREQTWTAQEMSISAAVSINDQLEEARAALWVWTASQDPDAVATRPFCGVEEHKVI